MYLSIKSYPTFSASTYIESATNFHYLQIRIYFDGSGRLLLRTSPSDESRCGYYVVCRLLHCLYIEFAMVGGSALFMNLSTQRSFDPTE